MKDRIFSLLKKTAIFLSGKGFGKLPILGMSWRFLSYIILKKTRPDFVKIDGQTIYLDKNDSLGLSLYGVYEVAETKFLKSALKEGDVFVDVGANIGYYTLLAAKIVGESGKVFAFEPDPENYNILKKNILVNGYNNVVIVNKAVSDKSEILPLFLSTKNSGDHRLYDNDSQRSFVNVETISLDEYFGNNYKIDFIKIDVQGAEGLVFNGMKNIVNSKNSLKILSEFWPNRLRVCGTDIGQYINSIISAGFKIYVLEKSADINSFDYSIFNKNITDNNFQVNMIFIR